MTILEKVAHVESGLTGKSLKLLVSISLLFFRAINYDEKDPFLCNSCGFCKYAKFDFTLTARACCAVDPVENDEDRKKVQRDVDHPPIVSARVGVILGWS